MPSHPVVPMAREAREALKHLKLARALLEASDDLTAIMFLDHAIASLRPGGSPLTIHPIR